MTQRVTTAYGPGVVVDSDTVRGRTSYKVDGEGFSIWLEAAQIPEFGQMAWDYDPARVDEENSTVLPYNPQPQFLPHSGESTIQPNQHLDTEKRLSPADSLRFTPQNPADRFPNNFAASRTAAGDFKLPNFRPPLTPHTGPDPGVKIDDGPFGEPTVVSESDWARISDDIDNGYSTGSFTGETGNPVAWRTASTHTAMDATREVEQFLASTAYQSGLDDAQSADDLWADLQEFIGPDALQAAIDQAEARGELSSGAAADLGNALGGYTSSVHTAEDQAGTADTWVDGPGYVPTSTDEEYPGGTNVPDDHSVEDIQARLGDKYIDIPTDRDHFSLQAQIDNDPAAVVSDVKMANFEKRSELDPMMGQLWDLEASDNGLRTAAWADVRAKATRLRRDGQVQLEAANPTAIVATVTGDHGIYDVAVLRGSALTGNSAVSEWTCSCPWGDWAFERQATYVGRLCSHAYAALQELRSLTMRKDNHPRDWSHKASVEADHDTGPDMAWPNRQDGFERGEPVDYPEGVDYPGQMYYDPITNQTYPIEGARYPREDGRLSTEPGTLTPDLNPTIPHTHERRRTDVQSGTPYGIAAMREAGWTEQQIEAFLSEPGNGVQRDSIGVSVGDPSADLQDINEDRGNPASPNGGDVRASADLAEKFNMGAPTVRSVEADLPENGLAADGSDDPDLTDVDDPDDVVAAFQRSAGAAALQGGSQSDSGGGGFDFAAAAQAFLETGEAPADPMVRTAGRSFTLAEQQALMDEDSIDGAPVDQGDFDLLGTHYQH